MTDPIKAQPSYVFIEKQLTVGNSPIADKHGSTPGLTVIRETVYRTSDVPTGMTIIGQAVFLQNFDLSFSGNDHHQVSHFRVNPSVTTNSSGDVQLALELILNDDNHHYISTDSKVQVLIVVQLGSIDDDESVSHASATSAIGYWNQLQSSAPNCVTGACTSTGPKTIGAVIGWDAKSKFSTPHKFRDFHFVTGGTHYEANPGDAWPWGDVIKFGGPEFKVNASNNDFDVDGVLSALGFDDALASPNPVQISAQKSSYRAGTDPDVLTFENPVAAAYAVLKNLTNTGDDGASNSLSQFTCSGVSTSIDGKTVSVDWREQSSKWKGAAGASWESVVDYLIIVQFAAPSDDSGSGGSGHDPSGLGTPGNGTSD